MDINKHIIEQRLKKILEDTPVWFEKIKDEKQRISRAFVLLATSTYLGIELDEMINIITDGGNDAGADAIYIGDMNDIEFPVTIFQAKYGFDLEKESNFPGNSVQKVVNAIGSIFDPSKPILMNEDLKPKVEEIRSLISDGYIPLVKCVFVNNGVKWSQDGENHIEGSGFSKSQVQFEHYNHEDIVQSLQNKKGIKASLQFRGKSIVEDFNYKRVLIGKVNVLEIAQLFESHGDSLLERNIRRYLGLNKNRVNESIQETLVGSKKENFYFYNNGVTIVCSKFSYNALQGNDWKVSAEDLQIINGGQSCKTIQSTIKENPNIDYSQVYILVRLYELAGQDIDDLINDITIATNSQNPVDLRDLRANDSIQNKLEIDLKELGYHYKRKKEGISQIDTIPSSVVAESVFSIWRKKPHQAKFKRTELFGKFYEEIFKDLNSAQAVLAVLIHRYCDTQRKRVELYSKYIHLPYSNYFIGYLIGKTILEEFKIPLKEVSHKNFNSIKNYFEKNKEKLFQDSIVKLENELPKLLPGKIQDIDPRRLSAVFRRGDLLSYL